MSDLTRFDSVHQIDPTPELVRLVGRLADLVVVLASWTDVPPNVGKACRSVREDAKRLADDYSTSVSTLCGVSTHQRATSVCDSGLGRIPRTT
jgi:hypothetical protein